MFSYYINDKEVNRDSIPSDFITLLENGAKLVGGYILGYKKSKGKCIYILLIIVGKYLILRMILNNI